MPLDTFLRKVERAIDGFAVYPPHHVRQVSPSPLPAALVTAKFVFVREDAVIPTLTPGYRGPYLLLDRRSKYFCFQIGSKQASVSVNHLNPAFSVDPITLVLLSLEEDLSATPWCFLHISAFLFQNFRKTQESPVPGPSSSSSIPCVPVCQNSYRSSGDRRIWVDYCSN